MKLFSLLASLVLVGGAAGCATKGGPQDQKEQGGTADAVSTMAEKNGWFIRVCTNKTEAQAIELEVGLGGNNDSHRGWTTWHSNEPVDIDFPADFRNAKEIWIKGKAVPKGRNANLCVFYRDHVVKHMDFDDNEEHEKSQSDTDNECACAQ